MARQAVRSESPTSAHVREHRDAARRGFETGRDLIRQRGSRFTGVLPDLIASPLVQSQKIPQQFFFCQQLFPNHDAVAGIEGPEMTGRNNRGRAVLPCPEHRQRRGAHRTLNLAGINGFRDQVSPWVVINGDLQSRLFNQITNNDIVNGTPGG